MERKVIEVAGWILIGFQLEQANLCTALICQNWRAWRYIFMHQFFTIQVIQDRHDLLVYQSKVFCTPGVSGASRPFQEGLRISIGPDTQTSMEMMRFKRGIRCQQVAEMIEQAIGLAWGRCLRQRGIVTPRSEIRRRYAWRHIGIFFGDEKATGGSQQVRMLIITSIEKMDDAVVDRDLPKHERCSLTLACIG